MVYASVARAGEAAVVLAHDADAAVGPGLLLGDARGGVGRSVIHDDDLEVAEGLRRQRDEGLGKRLGGVEGGDDDGGVGHGIDS